MRERPPKYESLHQDKSIQDSSLTLNPGYVFMHIQMQAVMANDNLVSGWLMHA